MTQHRWQFPRTVLAVGAVAALAACADQPTSPALHPTGGAALSSASPGDRPAQTSNSIKYRDEGLKPATGRSGSATLTVRALLGKDGDTDLEMTTGALDVATTAPGNISKLQVKGFDPAESLQFTKNFNNLKQGGYVAQEYPGRARHSKIQVQANIDGIDPKRTGVVTVTEVVKLRPDLAATKLEAPAKATVNTAVNIAATVAEINTDVGARANCVLYVDGSEADRADGIWVDAGSAVSCAFTKTFASTGTRELKVQVEEVVPGDYDVGNNSATASIEIVSGNDFYHYAYAQDIELDQWNKHDYSWESNDGTRKYEYGWEHTAKGRVQGAWIWGWMPKQLSLPLKEAVMSQSTNGATVHAATLADLDVQWSYSNGNGGCFWTANYGEVSGWTHLYVCSWGSSDYGWTDMSYGRYAGDVTYTSAHYEKHWNQNDGTDYSWMWNHSWDWKPGQFLAYGSDYNISLSLNDGTATYSASATIPLQPVEWSWNQPYSCWEGSNSDYTYKNCYGYSYWHKGVRGWTYGAPN